MICQHPDRHRIEITLAGGAAQRAVARKFNTSRDGVQRHWTRHVTAARKAELIAGPVKLGELAERAAEEGLSILDYLALVRLSLLSQFTAAAEAADRNGAAMLAGRLLEALRDIARLTGEIRATGINVTNNMLILSSPIFADLQAMLLQRLAPFPEARAAVIEGLAALDQRASGTPLPAPLIEHDAIEAVA